MVNIDLSVDEIALIKTLLNFAFEYGCLGENKPLGEHIYKKMEECF